jgi:hypothetical protein
MYRTMNIKRKYFIYALPLLFKIENNEMDGSYSSDGGVKRRVQGFGGET